MADLFSGDLPLDCLNEEISALTFTPAEHRRLCEIPCMVQMSECNRLWSYEQMMIGQIKAKGKQIKEKHIELIHRRFFRKFNHHYQKQLELEERHKEFLNNRHLHFNLLAQEFLDDPQYLNETNYEPLDEGSCSVSSAPSFNISYSRSEEVSIGAIESPPPRVQNIDSDDDLNDFVHNLAPGIEIGSEPIVETDAKVNSQPNTQSSSYSLFRRGVTMVSTQQP